MTNIHTEPRTKMVDAGILAAVAVLCIVPVLIFGPPTGSVDLTHHLQITNSYVSAFENGSLLPDLTTAENKGYGSVTVRFYPPLIHITIAVFKLIFGQMHLAVFAAFCLWSMIGGWGTYLLLNDSFKSRWPSLTGATLFALSPYHLNQFYNSFMWGEFAAMAIFPFIFLFAQRLLRQGGIGNVIGLGLSLALLILSNIPQAVIGLICLGIFIVFHLKRTRLAEQALQLGLSGALALGCSGFYWIRMVIEMSLINVSQPNFDPEYDYRNHFLLTRLEPGAPDMLFASLVFLIPVISVGILLFISGRIRTVLKDNTVRPYAALFAVSIFMMLPLSGPIWDNIHFLQRIQFPWRFLSMMNVVACVLFAYCTGFVNTESIRKRRPSVLILVGTLLIFATFSVKQVMLGAVFADPDDFDRVSEETISSVGLFHWLPVWADQRSFSSSEKVSAGNRPVGVMKWEPESREISIAEGDQTTVRTAILYYPHWHAMVNGREVPVRPENGAVTFDVGPEISDVRIEFREPSYTTLSRQASLASWGIVLMLIIVWLIVRRRRTTAFGYE